MGLFRVRIAIASMEGGVPVSIPEALVDTGSEYTWVPRAALAAAGAEAPDLVVFAEPGDLVLLGEHSLEGMNLRVDPVRKELIPAGPVITGCVA
jgi:hypothetical protein